MISVVDNRKPSPHHMPIRTSALRTLGAQGNVFAIEILSRRTGDRRGEDPVAFRCVICPTSGREM
jgi:hypothetical protein